MSTTMPGTRAPTPPFQPYLHAVAKNYQEQLVEWNPQCIKKSALIYQFEAKKDETILLVPDACCNMIFCCEPFYAKGYFQGVNLTSRRIHLTKGHTYFACKPYSVLGLRPKHTPIPDLLNKSADITDLYPNAENLISGLTNCFSFQERIDLLLRFKEEEMLTLDVDSHLVDEVIVLLCTEDTDNNETVSKMDYVEREVGYSKRYFRQKFGEIFGFPPSYYSRIIRFQNVLKDMFLKDEQCFATIAYENGYSDQSHLIRDFKSFTNTSPSAFIEQIDNLLRH
ncbi:helix-turn-helix domain-containing protein [Vagococcus acidifermentans]|uniref:HTH araC/xylS-type domain-containing protein n=1 Tax=Vagococcus acidifermentans TaxID=564710 RepID=A0A430ANM8_9ENTE|nr:helix-turn-helix domain-containing protein [Vagococcus acidifermentans]RSU09666.1 hypothetical protein CBF27_12320 [Vagococcus acidifermentans]